MFERVGLEFQRLKKQGQNSKVGKERTRIPMLIKIGQEFQCLKGWHQNTNV